MKNMNFRKMIFVVALITCGFVSSARAQFSVYAGITAERIGGFTCQVGSCASNDGKEKPYGGNYGASYDFRSFGPLILSADVRGSVLNSNKSATSYSASTDLVRHYSVLGGARVTVRTPFKVLRPYAEIAAGYGRLDQRYTQVEGFAGLDLAVFQNFDIRIVELGAGEMFGPSSHSLQSVGIGIVFHTSR